MERIDTDTLHFSYVVGYIPLALPLGELSPKVTERALHPNFPSPSSLRSATSPKGRGKGVVNRLMRSAHSVGCFLRYVITPEQKSPAAPFGAAGLIRFMGSA